MMQAMGGWSPRRGEFGRDMSAHLSSISGICAIFILSMISSLSYLASAANADGGNALGTMAGGQLTRRGNDL